MTSSRDAVPNSKIEAIFRSSPFAFKREENGSISANLTSGLTRLDYVLQCSEEKDGRVYAKLLTPVFAQSIVDPDNFCAHVLTVSAEGCPTLFFDHKKKCFCWEMEVRAKPKKFRNAVNTLVLNCDVLTGILKVTVRGDGTWDPAMVELAATPLETMH